MRDGEGITNFYRLTFIEALKSINTYAGFTEVNAWTKNEFSGGKGL